MDSPKDFDNIDPDDNLFRHFNDYCPSPLHHHFVDPPPPSPLINMAPATVDPTVAAQNNNYAGDNEFPFDFNMEDLLTFDADIFNDVMEQGGGEQPGTNIDPLPEVRTTGGAKPNSDAGPSGTKLPTFQWVPSGALDCSVRGCILASERSDYTNGLYNIRLHLHSLAGNLNHLVCDVENTDTEIYSDMETFIVNLAGQNLEQINGSLERYGIRIQEDSTILPLDTFINIYNNILGALATDHTGNSSTDPHSPSPLNTSNSADDNTDMEGASADVSPSANADHTNMNGAVIPETLDQVSAQFGAPWLESLGESSSNPRPATRNSRPNVGIQRERTANMTIADLMPYFHLKAEDASQQLNICPTTLKILCRKLKLGRWPFRKVQSIDNKLRKLRKLLKKRVEERNMAAIANVQEEIDREEERRRRLYEYLTRPR